MSLTNPTVPEKRARLVVRTREALRDPRPTRILAALGHPGYGNDFAQLVLDRWVVNPDLTLHDLTIGSR